MRVKTFAGQNLEDILPEIRADLGADAVVLSQKHVVTGGVGGFFGKRTLQVVAADRMPSDDELVDLEDDIVNGSGTGQVAGVSADAPAAAAPTPGNAAPARSGGLDLVADEWDALGVPEDALADHLAGMFERAAGQVVAAQDNTEATLRARERAAARGQHPQSGRTGGRPDAGGDRRLQTTPYAGSATGGLAPLDLPSRASTVIVEELPVAGAQAQQAVPATDLGATHGGASAAMEPLAHSQEAPRAQAGRMAARAHQAIAEATREIEQQLAYGRSTRAARGGGGGGHPVGNGDIPGGTSVLRAEVLDRSPEEAYGNDRRSGGPKLGIRVPQQRAFDDAHRDFPHVAARDDRAAHDLVEAARALELQLTETGVDVEVARSVVATVVAHRLPFSASDDLRELGRDVITEVMRVESGWAPVGRAQRIAVVGPSGSGKSSVVAKLAEGWRRMAGFDVGVISVVPVGDTVGAHEHTGDPLLRVRDLDVRFVSTPEQMAIVLERMRECDVVLIDTPSSAYLDTAAFASTAACLAAAGVDQVQAVIPLATSVREAESVLEHFRPMGVNRLVVSKLDESRYAGQLLNFGFRFGLPIPFVTDGQRVPEDIRVACAREIAALIVPHHSQEQ